MLQDGPGIAIELLIPKPDLVRGFRTMELKRTTIFDPAHGDPSHRALVVPPDIVHEAVMFSYFSFDGDPTLVYRGSLPGQEAFGEPPSSIVVGSANKPSTLGIYYQMEDVAAGMTEEMRAKMIAQDEKVHSDLVNSLLLVKTPDLAISHLKLDVYIPSPTGAPIADGPPDNIPSGMGFNQLHLWNRNELTNSDNLKQLKNGHIPGDAKCGDPSGCTHVFALDS